MNIQINRNQASQNSFYDVRPYVYGLSWKDQNTHYIGARVVNKTAPDDDLFKQYFTSSFYVEDYRKRFGKPDLIIIDTFDSADHAFRYETEILQTLKNVGFWDCLLNRNIGGEKYCTGKWLSEDAKRKIGAYSKQRIHTQETKLKIAASRKGVRHKPETKAKISKSHTGKRFTPEHKANLTAAKMGKKLSPEHIKKLSDAGLARRARVKEQSAPI